MSTRGQTKDDKPNDLTQTGAEKNPESGVESNLKGHLSLTSSYCKKKTEAQSDEVAHTKSADLSCKRMK